MSIKILWGFPDPKKHIQIYVKRFSFCESYEFEDQMLFE